MEVKELRIGNYLMYDGYFIKSYSVYGFINIIKNIDNYEPIPLTEEWLVKFGFLLDLHHHRRLTYSLNRITTYMQDGIFWCDILWDCLEIKYVHQLQNLYFALTNEELIILN